MSKRRTGGLEIVRESYVHSVITKRSLQIQGFIQAILKQQ